MSTYPPSVIIPGAVPDGLCLKSARTDSEKVGRLAGLLLPSFGSMIFVIVLLNVLFLSGGTRTLFRDSDSGWHIRTGEAILRQSVVPSADSYSMLQAGRLWYAWEWLAEVMLGAAHLFAGPAGVAMLGALAIAFTAWGSWRFALSLGANLFLSLAMMVPLLGTTSIHWLARPHLFSWLLGLAFVAIAERYRRGLAPTRSLWLLGVLSCFWANIHASFLLGPVLLLLYAAGEWLAGNHRSEVRRNFAVAALGSLLATFVNPYGWHVHQHVIAYLQNAYLMDHISEFRSFSFHAPGAIYVEIFLMLAALGTLCLFRQKAYGPALLSLALMHMSLYSARHLPMYAVLLAPIFVAAITSECSAQTSFRAIAGYSARLLAFDRRVWGAIPTVLALLVMCLALQSQSQAGAVGFDPQKFPVAAANFLGGENPASRRVFARDYWGGYLIYRFGGRLKVFVDGRSDFYGEQWLETYAQINEVKPGWDQLLDGYSLDTVLVPPDHPLAGALRLHPNWRLAYADSVAAVFERKAINH